MDDRTATSASRYAALTDRFLHEEETAQEGRAFGARCLKTGGKLFAVLADDRLVVKLPRARVDALVVAGEGTSFDPGHGRLWREWLALDPDATLDWLALVREAHAYVRG